MKQVIVKSDVSGREFCFDVKAVKSITFPMVQFGDDMGLQRGIVITFTDKQTMTLAALTWELFYK